jgi:hypothetical protein
MTGGSQFVFVFMIFAAILLILAIIAFAFAVYRVRKLRKGLPAPPLLEDRMPHREALSARHTEERLTEDDVQREILGPRGVPGQPSPVGMTPQRRKKTPRHLEPGHVS